MELDLNDEQRQIVEAVRRFARERVDIARLRAWEESADGIDPDTWQHAAALGWLGLGAPATCGGAGLSFEDVAVWFEEAARGLLPLPVLHAVRAIRCLAELEPGAPELPALIAGGSVLALSLPPVDPRSAGETGRLSLEPRGQQWIVSGEARFVSQGQRAKLHLALAWQGDTPVFVLLAPAAAERAPLATFDGDRQAHLRYQGASVVRVLRTREPARHAWERLWVEQQALALAEIVGIMDAVLERTVAYVKEREQFGQKIGAFQAVQHQVADMAMALTAGRHLARQAFTRLAQGTLQGFELDAAAAFLGPAGRRVTLTAHHLHGGAGYVVDHPLHYYSERALALALRYCPEETALARMAQWWLDGPELPPL